MSFHKRKKKKILGEENKKIAQLSSVKSYLFAMVKS